MSDFTEDYQAIDIRLVVKKDRSQQEISENIADALGIVIGPTVTPRECIIIEGGHHPVQFEEFIR